MVEALLSFLAGFIVPLLKGIVADWRRDKLLEDKGRAEAQADGNIEIAGKADEQARINAADRGGAADVLERLSKRIATGGANTDRASVPDADASRTPAKDRR